jgi:hypothetical protein
MAIALGLEIMVLSPSPLQEKDAQDDRDDADLDKPFPTSQDLLEKTSDRKAAAFNHGGIAD